METEWFNVPEISDFSDKPRRFTIEEIEYILASLPSVKCDDKEARDVGNIAIKKFIREQLYSVILAPSALGDFVAELETKFLGARITEGESVGVSTADALGESSTQVALNTFHVGGAATAALVGIEGLKSLIFAYQPKNKSTVIHLNKQINNFDEALDMRKSLEGISLGDLIDMNELEIDRFDQLGDTPEWYNYWNLTSSSGNFFSPSPDATVMRIKLKLDKLLYFNITMSELFDKIDSASDGDFDSGIVDIIYSPLSISTIDLHLKPEKIFSDNPGLQKFAEISFFRNTVIPVFEYSYIRGVPTIKKIYPVSFPVWEKSHSIVRRIYPNEEDSARSVFSDPRNKNVDNMWFVSLNRSLMSKSGIEDVELYGLFDSLGLEYNPVFYEDGDGNAQESKTDMYVHIPFKGIDDELSKFVRERKSGLPYIKDPEIISIVENKHVKYSNIRIFPHERGNYIKYDPKYIKYVLAHLKKRGFEWDLSTSIDIWRSTTYIDSKPVEKLSYEKPQEKVRDKVKGYLLTKQPVWFDGWDNSEEDNDKLTEILFKDKKYDYRRVFFLTQDFETYLSFHR